MSLLLEKLFLWIVHPASTIRISAVFSSFSHGQCGLKLFLKLHLIFCTFTLRFTNKFFHPFWDKEFSAPWTLWHGICWDLKISALGYFGTLQSNMDVLANGAHDSVMNYSCPDDSCQNLRCRNGGNPYVEQNLDSNLKSERN